MRSCVSCWLIGSVRRICFFQAEDGIRDLIVTGVQTCALPIFVGKRESATLIIVARKEQTRRESLVVTMSLVISCSCSCRRWAATHLRLWRDGRRGTDRKSTRLNSSHDQISYAVFCLKKKKEPH